MSSLPFWLSTRLGAGKRGTARTGSVIAILGVAFALAVMEITLAVSVGFKTEITSKLEGFVPPVTISAATEDGFVTMDETTMGPIAEVTPDATVIPVVSLPAVLKTDDDFAAIALYGHQADYDASFEQSNIVEGTWLDPTDRLSAVLPASVASRIGIKVGDRFIAGFFIDKRIKSRPFILTGTYSSGLNEYDNTVGYVNSDALRAVARVPGDAVTAIELRNIPIDSAANIGEELAAHYNFITVETESPDRIYSVSTIQSQGAIYLNWLELLDTNVVVIFILMALVAATTLVSSLFIQVLEKINAIGLLRALGATSGTISSVFVYISLRLTLLGIILGNIIGLGFIFIQSRWAVVSLDPEMYYLSSVPVHTDALSIVAVNVATLVAAWLILIVPARIATHLSPAGTLRFD